MQEERKGIKLFVDAVNRLPDTITRRPDFQVGIALTLGFSMQHRDKVTTVNGADLLDMLECWV